MNGLVVLVLERQTTARNVVAEEFQALLSASEEAGEESLAISSIKNSYFYYYYPLEVLFIYILDTY